MKTILLAVLFSLVLGFSVCVVKIAAEEPTFTPPTDSRLLIATTPRISTASILYQPSYNRVVISDWLTITGKPLPDSQSVTIYGNGIAHPFKPEDVVIRTGKLRPTVVMVKDGNWEIRFK